jgi:nickel transport protein
MSLTLAMIRLGVLVLLTALPALASAHEILHTVERGRAVAVHAYSADGKGFASCAYEVFSPSDPKVPHQKGHSDRNGWLAFVPDAPGRWRVKLADGTGHGLDLEVDASAPETAGTSALPTAAFVLRPLAGVVAVGAAFVALFTLYRRKGHSR